MCSMKDCLPNENYHAPALVQRKCVQRQIKNRVKTLPLLLADTNHVVKQLDDPESDDTSTRGETAEGRIPLARAADIQDK